MAHIDQVRVDQEANGQLWVLGADAGEQAEAVVRGGVAGKGTQGGTLNGGAVRHRIGEGNAEFEGVGAPSTRASTMARDNSGVGSPSITKGTKAP